MSILEEVEQPPEAAVLVIALPPKAPPIVQPLPREHPIRNVAQIYAVIPARALSDVRVTNSHLRPLCALGAHASGAWRDLAATGAHCGRGQSRPSWAYVKLKDLEAWGYVRRLKSFSSRKRRAITRQLMWEPDSPLPPKFTPEEKVDPTLSATPWMFNRSTEEGDDDMGMTLQQRQLTHGERSGPCACREHQA